MQKNQHAYGVFLPLKLHDRFMTAGQTSMTARLPIVAIDIATHKDPTGTRKGTILTNPRDDEDAYADLWFRAYLSWSTGELQQIGRELQYFDVFSIDVNRAERMVALLRKIRSAHEKLPVTPCDFGQYVTLLAPTVGIKYIVRPEDDETEARNHYPDGWYRILPVRDAQAYINNLVDDVREKYLAAAVGAGLK